MALTTYAQIARDIYVGLVTQGKLGKQGMEQAVQYSFDAAQVFIEHARKVDREEQERRRE